MLELEVISLGTILAVVLSGLGMGLYFSRACDYTYRVPTFITMLVMGWSYLIAIGVVQTFVQHDVTLVRAAERLALWGLFVVHSHVGWKFATAFRKRKVDKP